MAKFGGAQPGAGRPKGMQNKKTTELLERVAAEGIMPIDVFLNDMRYFYNLGENKMRIAEQESDVKKQAKHVRAALELKDIARDCARDAAPYLHPKLASLQGKIEVTNTEAKLAELE